MHEVFQSLLVLILILVISIFIDFHHWTINHKCSVISQSLQALLVVSFSEFWLQVLVKSTLFCILGFLALKNIVDVPQVLVVLVVLIITELLGAAIHIDINSICDHL